ncbi:hypothetical protein KIPB_015974, partial [Kipferlia bialata]|eukprot:g15974.t1
MRLCTLLPLNQCDMTKGGQDPLHFQCPCGAFLPTWATYVQHAVDCTKTHSTSVSVQSLPVFHNPPLSHFTEHTVGYARTRVALPSTPPFYSTVFNLLRNAGFSPSLYGSYQTVYATQTSDMDIALGKKTLFGAKTCLEKSRGVGTCIIIGGPKVKSRRHLK